MKVLNTNKDFFNNIRNAPENYDIEISEYDVVIYNGINEPKKYNKNDFIIMLFNEAGLNTQNINFI